MSHTPGPWVANVSDEARGGFGAIRVESENEHGEVNDGWCIAEFAGSDARHNALLAAAAPDLLKALKRFVHIYDRQGANGCGQTVQPVPPEIAAARAAIAKATGEE